jgi:hypothetical protein
MTDAASFAVAWCVGCAGGHGTGLISFRRREPAKKRKEK